MSSQLLVAAFVVAMGAFAIWVLATGNTNWPALNRSRRAKAALLLALVAFGAVVAALDVRFAFPG